ncbi:hypothetical protein LXL04_008446 [Taraxacum kok-saghyz]
MATVLVQSIPHNEDIYQGTKTHNGSPHYRFFTVVREVGYKERSGIFEIPFANLLLLFLLTLIVSAPPEFPPPYLRSLPEIASAAPFREHFYISDLRDIGIHLDQIITCKALDPLHNKLILSKTNKNDNSEIANNVFRRDSGHLTVSERINPQKKLRDYGWELRKPAPPAGMEFEGSIEAAIDHYNVMVSKYKPVAILIVDEFDGNQVSQFKPIFRNNKVLRFKAKTKNHCLCRQVWRSWRVMLATEAMTDR